MLSNTSRSENVSATVPFGSLEAILTFTSTLEMTTTPFSVLNVESVGVAAVHTDSVAARAKDAHRRVRVFVSMLPLLVVAAQRVAA